MAKKKGKVVSKNKKVNKKMNKINSDFQQNIINVLRVVVAVVAFLGVFYLLTVYITSKDTEDTSASTETEVSGTEIQYEEILAGSSFDIDENKYLVLYYDHSSEELSQLFTEKIHSYEVAKDHLNVYTVDLSNVFNKKFVTTEQSNHYPKDASEFRFNGPTLIKFIQGSVIDYVEGQDAILAYLGQ